MSVDTTNLITETAPITLSDEATARLDEISAQFDPPETETDEVNADEADQDEIDTEVVDTADWREDAEVKELAESLGLAPEKLARITSREALEAAAILHDEQLAAFGKSLRAPTHTETTVSDTAESTTGPANTGKVTPPASPVPQTKVTTEAAANDPFEAAFAKLAALSGDEYDPVYREALTGVAEATRLVRNENQQLRSTVTQLEQFANLVARQMHEQQQAQAEERNLQVQRDFHQFVDGLGHADLFGADPDSATPELHANRAKVWDQLVLLHTAESHKAGKHVPVTKSLINRAFKSVFADQLTSKALAAKNEQLKLQARKKLGGATRKVRPPQPRADLTVPASEDPAFMAKVRELREHHERGES